MFGLTPFVGRRSVSAYDPFAEFERLSDSFFGDRSLSALRADIKDAGDAYEMELDLPGMKKEDIHLDVEGDSLTIHAERHMENEEKGDDGSVLRRERSFGSFSRTFDISGVRADDIAAAYENGVLKLRMPKKQENVPASRRLEIQ